MCVLSLLCQYLLLDASPSLRVDHASVSFSRLIMYYAAKNSNAPQVQQVYYIIFSAHTLQNTNLSKTKSVKVLLHTVYYSCIYIYTNIIIPLIQNLFAIRVSRSS